MMTGIGIPTSQRRTPRMSDPIGYCGTRYKRERQGLVLADNLFDRVLRLADAAADVAFTLFHRALGFEASVAGHLSGLFLDRAGRLFQAAFHALFIHRHAPSISVPQKQTSTSQWRFRHSCSCYPT